MEVKYIIIHCTATPEGRDVTASDVDRWHRARGFKSIGYHYLIRLDGTIEKGRPESMIGAHTLGQNSSSIGVCYVGGLSRDGKTPRDTRTDAQRKALEALIRDLLRRYPGAVVRGHRDFAAKACPSFDATTEYRRLLPLFVLILLTFFLSSCGSSRKTVAIQSDSVIQTTSLRQIHESTIRSLDSLNLSLIEPEIRITRPDSVKIVISATRATAGRTLRSTVTIRDTITLTDTVTVTSYVASSDKRHTRPSPTLSLLPLIIFITLLYLIIVKK